VILFRRNINDLGQVAHAIDEIVRAFPEDLPPLIAVDQEGGRVARLGPPVLKLPPMRALGDIDDPLLTERAGELLGDQLACLGFNICFAPVLDVDTNPDNPIIGDRSFSRDPDRVIRHGLAFARGLGQSGVLACGKHFPGHGDTDLDSHLALPRLPHDLDRLRQVELPPFKAAVGQIPTVMTAHVIFEAINPTLPATICREVVTGLLRDELGYDGLVFSDDLEMKALSDHWSYDEAAWRAIDAGCDVLLVCSDANALTLSRKGLIDRATDDPEFRSRLIRAADRHITLRRSHPPSPVVDEALRRERLETDVHHRFLQTLASRLGS
jgi:beta-N-acetylhexosaminidase